MVNLWGLTIHIYGVLIGVAVFAASEVSLWLADKRQIGREYILAGFWWVVLPAIAGARIYHVVHLWAAYYSSHPEEIIKIWNGGLGIWGAILGGLGGCVMYFLWLRRKKTGLGFAELADVAVIGVPLGQAIGRIGNLVNKEAYGMRTEMPWGMAVDGVRVHPWFFYEAAANLALTGILVTMAKRGVKPGVITAAYLIGYGLIRMSLEPLRGDERLWMMGGIPTAMMVGAAMMVTGIFMWRLSNRRSV